MAEQNNINIAFSALQNTMYSYLNLSDTTWNALKEICTFRYIKKNDCICRFNEYSDGFFFVSVGLFRTYILNEKGNEYNKNFFFENTFPGSMVALIKNETSNFEIQALENSEIIHIDFKKYRKLLLKYDDLKMFHIYYLEKNWLISKDAREVDIVQKDADERYDEFLETYGNLSLRLTQYHIASHLGITPTQLSRIRKKRV
jgi:CRP-like cAMP-binding protein